MTEEAKSTSESLTTVPPKPCGRPKKTAPEAFSPPQTENPITLKTQSPPSGQKEYLPPTQSLPPLERVSDSMAAPQSRSDPIGLRRWESVPLLLLGELFVEGKRWAFRIPLLEVKGYGETPDMAKHQAMCQVKQMDADARHTEG